MPKIYDTLIIGGGPAGLSVALGLGRIHRSCIVFSDKVFRNAGVHASHTVLSRDHISPEEIRGIGHQQIERYGNTEFEETMIVRLSKEEKGGVNAFTAEDASGKKWEGRTLALAMGSQDIFPEMEGYADNWPLNIYQCLFCDGHERFHLPKAVLAWPWSPMYIPMASMVHWQGLQAGADPVPIIKDGKVEESKVTVLTNGVQLDETDESVKKMREMANALGIRIDDREITKLVPAQGKDGLDVVFDDSSSLHMGFLVHKPPTRPHSEDLIAQLGVETAENPLGRDVVRIEPMGATNVQGVFVAGDVGTRLKQVSIAMAQGGIAAGGLRMNWRRRMRGLRL